VQPLRYNMLSHLKKIQKKCKNGVTAKLCQSQESSYPFRNMINTGKSNS
jgi:hypothetical protein